MENQYNLYFDSAQKKWSNIAIPLGSLGILQENISKICAIQKTLNPQIDKKCVVVFCADNGVVAQGISQTGSDVTSIVAHNMCIGNSAMCKAASICGCDVIPVDIGMKREINHHKILQKSIMPGTNDFSKMVAISREDVRKAINVGMKMVEENLSYDVFATGEMGIGNTTTSSAVASVLLGINPMEITGVGAGLSSEGLARKIDIIEKAIEFHKPDKNDVIDVLSKVSGLDICGMVGLILGCIKYKKVCILDGFISNVAALCAQKLDNSSRDFIISSHKSDYKSTEKLLLELNLKPIIDAGLRLGEGSGAVMCMPILDMAIKIFNEMPTFEETSIEAYKPLS